LSNKNVISDYTGISEIPNTLAGDSIGIALRIEDVILSPRQVLSKEGVMVDIKSQKINNTYNQITVLLLIFAAVSLYSLISGKIMDRLGSSLLLILAISAFIAFVNDKERWRQHSER
jgi:MFS family permease